MLRRRKKSRGGGEVRRVVVEKRPERTGQQRLDRRDEGGDLHILGQRCVSLKKKTERGE